MNRKITIVLLVIATLAISFVAMKGLSSLKESPKKNLDKKKLPFVKVEAVKYNEISSPIVEKGRLASNLEVNLSSEVAGRIVGTGVPLKVGQKFKKGQLLIRIYEEDAKMDLRALKSRFLNKLAENLPDIKVDYADNFEAWMNFFNAINLEESIPELPKVKSDQEKVFMASRNILGDYYAIKSAEVKLDKRKIYAPFDGSYAEVNTQIGSVAGMGTKLAGIIESNNLELQVPIESKEISWLSLNEKVDILDSDGEVVFTGKLVRKSDFVDEGTQSISVFVKLEKTNGNELYQGQFLTARFNGKKIANAMEIPRNAVFSSNKVFVVEGGILKEKEIKVIKRNENTLVFNGLKEGEILVVEPPVKATENMQVQIKK
ncbi:efflux RND transporter periplasmic adaptor subunit [Labilibaculum euxinus]|uniref:Efflux RND transporter periplasmic adaptor subunit n=1 Tax=Labilibaculum euxinus TaxID=2686357 RepID=A0A7M4DAW6_9BACT|nr:efflux RND transporter periplasmic adaptor subunit [Labilibaculum euxinus]MUP39795.1 efflux RND transporter periplasmic adaptor subunit [Labilibaculum euxinus]MVB09000.1 efflux RND transporter periplasmic adaptor subunit [Labilibaculum euxinus]